MPHIVVDLNSCEGYGNCVAAAPAFFDIDDEGLVALLRADVPDDSRNAVVEAVRSCPAAALRLET